MTTADTRHADESTDPAVLLAKPPIEAEMPRGPAAFEADEGDADGPDGGDTGIEAPR